MARTYGSRATLNAQNVYQTSNQIFSQQREAQAEEMLT